MKHIEQHHSRHAAPQLFDLVADVEQYPDFVPWVISARVTRRESRKIWTDLTMGTRLLHKQFATVALLARPHRIDVNSYDPMFRCFDQVWTFEPTTNGTVVEYRLDLIFKSQIMQALIGASFAERAKTMMRAYMRRAERLSGTPQVSLRDGQRSTGRPTMMT